MADINKLFIAQPNALHSPWRNALGTPPSVYNGRAKVWMQDASTADAPRILMGSGLPGGAEPVLIGDPNGVVVHGVVGFNKSATRLFFRIRTQDASTYTTIVAFPVEGLQAFAHAQAFTIAQPYTVLFDFAANELATTPTTTGAFYGTVFWGAAIPNPDIT